VVDELSRADWLRAEQIDSRTEKAGLIKPAPIGDRSSRVLPTLQIVRPLLNVIGVPTEEVLGCRLRLKWLAKQLHVRLCRVAASFAAVALRASRHQVFPVVSPSSMARYDVIEGQATGSLPTVLAAVAVSTQDLSLAEANTRAGAMDHVHEADNRGALVGAGDRPDHASAVLQYRGLPGQDQAHCPSGVTYVERFVIPVKNQNGVAQLPLDPERAPPRVLQTLGPAWAATMISVGPDRHP
jgi:hypothetical protein